jgi:hypothetical protein
MNPSDELGIGTQIHEVEMAVHQRNRRDEESGGYAAGEASVAVGQGRKSASPTTATSTADTDTEAMGAMLRTLLAKMGAQEQMIRQLQAEVRDRRDDRGRGCRCGRNGRLARARGTPSQA